MTELYYIPSAIAQWMASRKTGMRSQLYLLDVLFKEEYAFIHPNYKKKRNLFISQTMHHLSFFLDNAYLDAEFPAIQKDFRHLGKEIEREDILSSEYADLDLFFMFMRLNILYSGPKDYTRRKMRTIIRAYGYKRRSTQLMRHIQDCLLFYHLQPYCFGEPCDLARIQLDDMITFRLQ